MGKGKGQGKGKENKGKGKATWCAAKTQDGKPICYAFNNPSEGCKNPKCTFAHVCGKCFALGNPLFSCDHKA